MDFPQAACHGQAHGTHQDTLADGDPCATGPSCRKTAASPPDAGVCDSDGCAGGGMYRSSEKHHHGIRDARRHLYLNTYGGVGNRLERDDSFDQRDSSHKLNKSISSELLTWLVGKVSAFGLRMRGGDRTTHAKLSTREQRIERPQTTDLRVGPQKLTSELLEFPELLHFSLGFLDRRRGGQRFRDGLTSTL